MIDVHACGCWFVRAWPLSRGSAADFQQLASLLDVAVGPVFGGRVWMDWPLYACKFIIHLCEFQWDQQEQLKAPFNLLPQSSKCFSTGLVSDPSQYETLAITSL